MATQGKCDVCGKIKELEPPRQKFLNVPDDYLMLCLECRAKVGTRVDQASLPDIIMTSKDACPTVSHKGKNHEKK